MWLWSSPPTLSSSQLISPENLLLSTSTPRTAVPVSADIEPLVAREDERLGHLDATLTNLLAVVVEGHVTALGVATTVVGELGTHLVLAGRHRFVGLGREHLDTEQVVGELRLAVLGVVQPPKAPP